MVTNVVAARMARQSMLRGMSHNRLSLADINLAGDGGGNQGGVAFLQQVNGALDFGGGRWRGKLVGNHFSVKKMRENDLRGESKIKRNSSYGGTILPDSADPD